MCTQAVLPDMPHAASAPVADVQAQACPAQQHTQQHSQRHSQQLSQQHSGQYGLVDEDEDDDVGDDEHAEVPSHNTSDEHQAALQVQEDEEEGARARQQPAPAHVTPCLHPPPLPRQPMCRLFRYTCGLCSLCAGRCKGYHAWCLVRDES